MLLAGRAVERHFKPVKMNYEVLGNAVPHLHAHVIPRCLDDPAPGRPLPSDLLRADRGEKRQFEGDAAALRELLAGSAV